MRDSFFGLHIRPTIKQAPSPNRDLGTRLVNLYFDYANPQIPILHRGDFTTPFNRVYLSEEGSRTPRELYMLNIVFAIGAGIILGDSDPTDSPASAQSTSPINVIQHIQASKGEDCQPGSINQRSTMLRQPFIWLGLSSAGDRADGSGGPLRSFKRSSFLQVLPCPDLLHLDYGTLSALLCAWQSISACTTRTEQG